jgi:hypothetical protein
MRLTSRLTGTMDTIGITDTGITDGIRMDTTAATMTLITHTAIPMGLGFPSTSVNSKTN